MTDLTKTGPGGYGAPERQQSTAPTITPLEALRALQRTGDFVADNFCFELGGLPGDEPEATDRDGNFFVANGEPGSEITADNFWLEG